MSAISVFLIASCLPSIVLLIYIYNKDKADKEPFKLLFLLFALGALSCFPIAYIEVLVAGFNPYIKDSIAYNIYDNYLVAATCEEVGKFIILFLITRKSKHFNCLFDGMIYAVVVSLGFATLENIMYVANYGFATAIVRAVTAVPGHMFDGVLMGYFYTMWHFGKSLEATEQNYLKAGLIDEINHSDYKLSYKGQIVLSLLVPIAAHGTYDFLASSNSVLGVILFYAFLIVLYVHCFKKVKKLSAADTHEANMIAGVLYKRYPYLFDRIRKQNAVPQNLPVLK